jgi:thiol-disulfide isomerase/thioredoxin
MKINSTLKLLIILSTLISCILSCKNEKQQVAKPLKESPKLQIIEEKLAIPSNKITLLGKSDDSMALKYLNFLNFSKFGFGHSTIDEERSIIKDSLHLIMRGVNTPQLMDLIAFSDRKDKKGYLSRVFFTPGDSIFMDVKNGAIKFSGKNEAHYNFFLKMDDPTRQNWAIYKDNPQLYKNELLESYKLKDSFFKSYIKKNPNVSEEFKNLVGDELKFEYLYHLMLPRNKKDQNVEGKYQNDGNTIFELSDVKNNSENLFVAKNYFHTITLEDFNKPKLINNDYFKRSLNLYIRHYFTNQDYLEYSRSNFLKEKEFIEENLEGELKTYAIARLINDYHLKGFGHGEQDIPILRNLIIEYADRFTEESLVNRMNEILEDLNAIDFILPDSVLDEKLLTLSGDTIKLKQILASNKTKVIDYWASWCEPCIDEFHKAKAFKKRIKKEANLEYIYISIDDDKTKWTKRILELEYTLKPENQYLIINRKNSKILKQMLIRNNINSTNFSIPRYCIIDSNNKIISNNSPRPSDSLAFKRIIKKINP